MRKLSTALALTGMYIVTSLCLLSLTAGLSAADEILSSFTEDFSSKLFCDTLNTTAWWDTVAGELKLYPFELITVGSYNTPSNARGIAISGDYAYVGDGYSGLQVINISNPASPVLAGSRTTPGNARGVAVSGDYAYLAG